MLVFFHGGGFTHGYKEWCGFMAPALTAHPAILVSAEYRLLVAQNLLRRFFLETTGAGENLVREVAA